MEEHVYDYRVEYAKSNRASCKGCKSKIDKDVLRLARMVQSRHHDGRDPLWYHFECFFPKQAKGVRSSADLEGFGSLRWEEAELVKEKLGETGATCWLFASNAIFPSVTFVRMVS